MPDLHPLNRYAKSKPDFAALATKYPSFAPYVITSNGVPTVDFKDAAALRALTTVLLKEDWNLGVDLREDRLCPTVSSRLDYVLHILDLEGYLEERDWNVSEDTSIEDSIKEKKAIRVLDVGTGHVAIYPLLLHRLRPDSMVYATESDQTSLDHSTKTLQQNNIAPEQIKLLKASQSGQILFPLNDIEVDITMCNPPFYSSLQELEDGSGKKVQAPFAAPTAAHNELITRGGEVSFVSQMINESCKLRHRSKWFTSLIGIYASLQPLVDLLRSLRIDNYFVKSIKPSKTTRWILGWSFGRVRLPDSLTQPPSLISGTSYSKLISHSNTLRHTPIHPPLSTTQLRQAVLPVLESIKLGSEGANAFKSKDEIILRPPANTWSRAARRLAARGDAIDQSKEQDQPMEPRDNLFAARLSFIDPIPPSEAACNESDEIENAYKKRTTHATTGMNGDWRGSTLILHFLSGEDRDIIDAFWKFLLNKAGLIGSNTSGQGETEARDDEANVYLDTGRKRGRSERGARGGRRGRGRVKMF